jgi:hypothetical protein
MRLRFVLLSLSVLNLSSCDSETIDHVGKISESGRLSVVFGLICVILCVLLSSFNPFRLTIL